MRNEAEINAGRPAYITKDELTKWQQGAPGYESVDLYDAVFNKHATQFQTTLSLEGGTDKVSYYGSFGYATDNSLLKNSALTYDKYTFRSNVSLKITKDLTASINLGGRYDTTNRPWFPFYDIFKSTRVNPPTTSIYANDNPDYYNNFSYVPNPAAMIDADYTGSAKERNKNLQTQFALEYNIPYVKGLKVKGTFIYDYNNYGYKATRKGFKTYTYGEYTGEYTAADGDAFLLGTQEEVPTLLLSTCGTDASKRLAVWCERQEEKGGQIGYSDEEAEVQEAGDDLAFLDGEFVENETHDFI